MYAIGFYFMVCNVVKILSSNRTIPAVQAGVTNFLLDMKGIVMMSETM